MPRTLPLLLVSLLALASLAPHTMGAPLVPDVLNGFGTAATFQVFGQGQAIEGGLYDWSDLCARCVMLLTVGQGTFLVSDSEGFVRQLEPGVYEIREYVGLFMHSEAARWQHDVQLHGVGKVEKL